MTSEIGSSLRQRRRFTVSLRALMLLVLVAALPLWRVHRARTQAQAVAQVKTAGGFVMYDYQFDGTYPYKWDALPWAPVWLRRAVGEEYFREVTSVIFGDETTDDQLAVIEDLDRLLEFELGGSIHRKKYKIDRMNKRVSDAGLAHLAHQTSVRAVRLFGEKISDAGLVHLVTLPHLQKLDLWDAPHITDAGMAHVVKMTELRDLSLPSYTAITDAGVAQITKLPHLQKLKTCRVTDAGMQHLKGITELQELNLTCAPISDAGLSGLKELKGLRKLDLSWNLRITDAGLANLAGLTELRDLDLSWTHITGAGLRHLRGLRQLDRLNLEHTRVSDAEAAAIKTAIPGLATSLQERPFP